MEIRDVFEMDILEFGFEFPASWLLWKLNSYSNVSLTRDIYQTNLNRVAQYLRGELKYFLQYEQYEHTERW